MKRAIFIFIHFYFYYAVHAQHSDKVIFNKKAQFEVETVDTWLKINALGASISTNKGNFDIYLLDFNQNGNYIDTIINNKKLIDVNDRDFLLLTEYNLSRSIHTSDGSLLLTNNFSPKSTFVINGNLFRISDYNKKGDIYSATVSFVENNMNWDISSMEFYKKTMNKIIVDRLNPVEVLNLKTNTIQNIQTFLQKGKYLYIDFIASWCSPCFQEAKNIQKAKLPENINYLAVAVESDKEDIEQLFKTHDIDKWDNVFIEKGDYEKMVKIGGIDFPFGILFNDKGEVVLYGARLYDLTNYFNAN